MRNDNEIPFGPDALAAASLQDLPQAVRNLAQIQARLGKDASRKVLPEILAALRRAGDPDMALTHFERFVGALDPVSAFAGAAGRDPSIIVSLIILFGASRFLSSFAAATADETLHLLSQAGYLAHAAERDALATRLAAALAGDAQEEDFLRALRFFRKRELMRIALRDLLGKADLTEVVTEISNLADVCLQAAHERAEAELRRRFGRPFVRGEDGAEEPAGFSVIGMGKLGGSELNFSSDVDLMYVYRADGETEGIAGPDGAVSGRITNHQYFVKLAERMSAAIGRTTEDGFVFRVDLRLRPEGQRGPLAQSLGGYEIYYESWGQTWERSALIKARPVAGDEAVGREFLTRIAPFVYRKYLDFGAIAEIRDMKHKINREVQRKGRAGSDVKLGYGGIREIEFLVQALQLIYGGRDRTLRERSCLKALHILAQKGLLTYQEIADLSAAYVFLRTVEHRIQMLHDLQTQTLPSGEQELRALARRSGYLEPGRERELLLRDLDAHTRKVRGIYDDLLGKDPGAGEGDHAPPEVTLLMDPATEEQEATDVLARSGFRDPSRAFRNIVLLREGQAFMHQTPRSRRVFNELFPQLFRSMAGSADPDLALHHLEAYLAAQGSWDAFQSFVRQDPKIIDILVSVFSSSEYFSRMLVRTPGLLEELLGATAGADAGAAETLDRGLATALEKYTTITDKLDALRRFKHREELRIGMADLSGALPLRRVCRELSRLAEACLAGALMLAARETAKRFGNSPEEGALKGLAVIAAGKLGGREILYGSDLDIFFVYDAGRAARPPGGVTAFEFFSKVAERTLSYLTTMTREGAAYRVDTRLRPTGSKGTLVQTVEAVRQYFSEQAETWERQAMINARFVAGDRVIGKELGELLQTAVFREADPADLAQAVRTMRKRMQEELGREDGKQYNIKQGAGGLVDIDFLSQYFQLLLGRRDRGLRIPGTFNTIRALARGGALSRDAARLLRDAYLFLRRLDSRMRIVTNLSHSMLSREPDRLQRLARRMGYQDGVSAAGEQLLADYERTSRAVRSLFDRVVNPGG